MAEGFARYDAVADFYVDQHPDSYDTDVDAALFELLGPLGGARVVDIACGHGRISRELARRGAHVVGVDLSPVLIGHAHRAQQVEPLAIDYIVGDASAGDLLVDDTFDLAVSNFGLSDIDDLDGALATVHRLLRPGAHLVFSILHPCFPGRGPAVAPAWAPGAGYFREGRWTTDAPNSTLRQQVGANHRMLSTYLGAVIAHGFVVDDLAEPTPPAAWHAATPGLDPVPTFLVVRATRPAGA